MESKRIATPFDIKTPVLAFGSQTKNTLCFARGRYAYISGVHQDLSDPQDFMAFARDARRFLSQGPKIIAYDMHPEYQSSKFALGLSDAGYKLQAVQHHHAHIASCMADNGMAGNTKVIGVAFDGTGFGADNTLWGAEFLISGYKNFQRRAHLKEVALIGAEQAIRQPWRVAAAWLYSIYKDGFLNLKAGFVKKLNKRKWGILKNAYTAQINSPLASSMGRLFDAAASLVLSKSDARFEAELAIELERAASSSKPVSPQAAGYKFNITNRGGVYTVDPSLIFKGIIKDLLLKEPQKKIAYKFHLSAATIIERVCLRLREESGINKVVLSGGVFQNSLLLKMALGLLYKHKFDVFIHNNLACNDSCVALGQAVAAGMGE